MARWRRRREAHARMRAIPLVELSQPSASRLLNAAFSRHGFVVVLTVCSTSLA